MEQINSRSDMQADKGYATSKSSSRIAESNDDDEMRDEEMLEDDQIDLSYNHISNHRVKGSTVTDTNEDDFYD